MKRLTLTALVAVFALGLCGTAHGAFGLKDLDVTFTNQDGSPATQAGAHPYALTTSLAFNTATDPIFGEVPAEDLKDLVVAQVPGLVGDPGAVPRCANAVFLSPSASCPDSTAVGVNDVYTGAPQHVPVFSLVAPPGTAAKLGFVVLGVPATIELSVNPAPPYNVIARLTNVPQVLAIYNSQLTVWGNPADPSHDDERGRCAGAGGSSCAANIANTPFLTAPRACQGPLPTSFRADSWQNPGVFDEPPAVLTHDDAEPPNPLGFTGCGKLGFSPSIAAQPTSKAASSPSGLDFSLDVDDEGLANPSGVAGSDIEKTEVTLPEGFSANPSLAEGLNVCTEAELARETAFSEAGAGCPNASKIGTVEVETPLLDENVNGSLYIAKPYENPFQSLLALYVVIKNPTLGIIVKQPLKVIPDPVTGQLTTVAEDMPQLPFSHFKLHFREGTRSPLATPSGCGAYEVESGAHPLVGRSPPDNHLHLPDHHRPRRRPLPHRRPAALPARPDRRHASTTPPGASPPSTSASSEPTPNRSSPASRSSCRRGSPASWPASPTAPTRRSPQPRQGQASTAARKSSNRPPAPRHRRSATPWPEQESAQSSPTPPARSTSPAPTTAPTSRSWRSPPAKVGPFDLGTVVDPRGLQDRPRNRRSLHRRHRLGPDPPHHQGHPGPPQGHPRLRRQTRLRPQPDRLHQDLDRIDAPGIGLELRLRSRRQPDHGLHPLPGSRLRRPSLQAEAGPEAEGRHQARRLPRLHGDPEDERDRRSRDRQSPGDPAQVGVHRERPLQHDLHQGPVQGRSGQRSTVPGRIDLRQGQGDDPDPRRTADRPRLPALLRTPAPRPGRRPAQLPDRLRPGRPESTRSKEASGTPSKPPPMPRSPPSP